MRLVAVRHTWGLAGDPAARLAELHARGYRGLECGVEAMSDDLRRRLAGLGWVWIAQVWTDHWRYSGDPAVHLRSFAEQARRAADLGAELVNAHAGEDGWEEDVAAGFLADLADAAARHGVRLACETHRGRILATPWATLRLCRRLPWLRLTADYSHFCVVAERLPPAALLAPLAARVDHVHARVGHAQGPQVDDPSAPRHTGALAAHEAWWAEIRAAARAAGRASLSYCPEFGPPPYQPTDAAGLPTTGLEAVCDWMAQRFADQDRAS
jgi:sugar phosphate isomerase/epimerase